MDNNTFQMTVDIKVRQRKSNIRVYLSLKYYYLRIFISIDIKHKLIKYEKNDKLIDTIILGFLLSQSYKRISNIIPLIIFVRN
jgi:hypothetical protein